MRCQIKDRFVAAHKLTLKEAEDYLWADGSLPEGIRFSAANHHPINRTISYFCARTTNELRVEIGDWFVKYSDGSMQVFNEFEFHNEFEEVA